MLGFFHDDLENLIMARRSARNGSQFGDSNNERSNHGNSIEETGDPSNRLRGTEGQLNGAGSNGGKQKGADSQSANSTDSNSNRAVSNVSRSAYGAESMPILGRKTTEPAPAKKSPETERSLTHSPYFCGTIYERMSEDLHLAGMSQRTHEGYLRAVRKLADYWKTSPDKITEQQLRKHFLFLKNDCEFASGSLRVAYSGIKFFYTRSCRRHWETLAQMRVPASQTLPEVITREQVHKIIEACRTLRMATYFWTAYSLGLRMQEALCLEVGDIDSARMMVHVHRGKGAKDRYIPLPESTLVMLREYWKTHRHPRFMFPADGRDHRGINLRRGPSNAVTVMSPTAVQGAMKQITRKLHFGKKVSIHTLRHSFATHLLEAGISLRAIQQYLGHSSLQTTMVYLHLTDSAAIDVRQVINELFVRPNDYQSSAASSKPSTPAASVSKRSQQE